jgi:nitroreductase
MPYWLARSNKFNKRQKRNLMNTVDSSIASVEEVMVNGLLRQRRSGRAYDAARPLTDADLQALLEAARWAPSGGNQQPWRYVVGRKGDATYDRLASLLEGGNRIWAQHAPVLLLTAFVAYRINQTGERVLNRTAMHDLGMANISIALEAVNRGLMAHMMGGFNHDAARELIQAEANNLDLGPMMSIGFEGDPSHLSAELQKREKNPRVRKDMRELLIQV